MKGQRRRALTTAHTAPLALNLGVVQPGSSSATPPPMIAWRYHTAIPSVNTPLPDGSHARQRISGTVPELQANSILVFFLSAVVSKLHLLPPGWEYTMDNVGLEKRSSWALPRAGIRLPSYSIGFAGGRSPMKAVGMADSRGHLSGDLVFPGMASRQSGPMCVCGEAAVDPHPARRMWEDRPIARGGGGGGAGVLVTFKHISPRCSLRGYQIGGNWMRSEGHPPKPAQEMQSSAIKSLPVPGTYSGEKMCPALMRGLPPTTLAAVLPASPIMPSPLPAMTQPAESSAILGKLTAFWCGFSPSSFLACMLQRSFQKTEHFIDPSVIFRGFLPRPAV